MYYKVSESFSECPGGRYIEEGPKSGEEFRDNHLIPLIYSTLEQNEQLILDLDGGYGYSTGFLEETFGGLVRKCFNKEILSIITIISNDEPKLIDEIKSYISDEQSRKLKCKGSAHK